jgi:hypothetical protein
VIGPFDPTSYPGQRPGGPALVVDGRVVPVALDGPARAPLRTPVDAAVLADGAVRWVVAYGSNAAPSRLVDKGLDRRGAVVLPAELIGWVPAYEARRTGYGAVPLTLVPEEGARTATWVLGIHRDDTHLLDASEGSNYELGRVGDVTVAGRFVVRDALAYLPAVDVEVQLLDEGWRTWPEHDQAAAARHLAADGPCAPAPRIHRRLEPPWPVTRLEPR